MLTLGKMTSAGLLIAAPLERHLAVLH